jgi:site-specific DNA recombinase
VKDKVLCQESLEELVGLVNAELDSGHDTLKERLDAINAELNEVQARLSRLYDALETNKLSLDDLAPRIKDLRSRQDELTRSRLRLEAEQGTRKARHLDARTVKAYAEDLKRLLEEGRVPESKAFLRSFIKRIEIDGGSARIDYVVPVPPNVGEVESVGVLSMANLGGAEGIRTPDLLLAKQALSRLSYSPRKDIVADSPRCQESNIAESSNKAITARGSGSGYPGCNC